MGGVGYLSAEDMGRWQGYLASFRKDAASIHRYDAVDAHRRTEQQELRALIDSFVNGAVDLESFRKGFDHATRVGPDLFGLRGASGAMAINKLVKHVPETEGVAEALREALKVPKTEAVGRRQMKAWLDYVDALIRAGVASKGDIQPKRGAFLLSTCWHLSDSRLWPVYYQSARERFNEEDLFEPAKDPAESYFKFRALYLALEEALGAKQWELEHLCRWLEGERGEGEVPGSAVAEPGATYGDVSWAEGEAWLFQANPNYFDIRGALRSLDKFTWLAKQHYKQIRRGHRVFFWESGSEGGVLGCGTILSDPEEIPQDEASAVFMIASEKFSEVERRVWIQVEHVLDRPLPRAELLSDLILKDLIIFKIANATNFRLKPHEHWELFHRCGKNPQEPRWWLVGAGELGGKWDEFYEDGVVRIGFRHDFGSLANLTKEEIAGKAKEGLEAGIDPRNDIHALYQFAHEMAPGDRIFVKRGRRRIVGFGIVTSSYRYDAGRSDYWHVRDVGWISRGEWDFPEALGTLPVKTLTDMTPYAGHVEALVQNLSGQVENRRGESVKPYSVEEALEGVFLSRERFEETLEAWRRKKNLILQGPPGVGKTFLAKRLAYALLKERDERRLTMVQFHQSMSYEDFIQGYRPLEAGGFVLKEGPFFGFCKLARQDPDRDYVFIIDEINRGNLGKIFGELMMLIETDKREVSSAIPLAYSRDSDPPFFVPENLYLLGLMNTADRSLAMVDYALRRRFRFIALLPEFESPRFREFLTSRGASDEIVSLVIERMTSLNAAIAEDGKNLGRGYEIGHSFFCPNDARNDVDKTWFAEIVRTEVLPLLEEYWFDDEEKVAAWRTKLLR